MYRRLLVSQNNEVYCLVTSFGKQSIKQIYDNYVCQEFIKISRRIAEDAADMVKGERESVNMFEIN